MKHFTLLAVVAASLSLTSMPAAAGDASMTRSDGMEITIKCRSSGCNVQGKKPGGKWGTVEKTAGGSENFNKLRAKYEGMGFAG
ncbi:MAG: hypothetical protein ACQEVT_11905 [Pseudomonadota bacterium]|uniref:hypothetical protein n=1 Tax=Roseovarius TaxID=74030 RepID=UPI0022A67996|nr:hypothetical protein [Roseovarius sp. EGI FJ00037]MCZ0810951.1 hypothetical protein [Roseovarius sp. EGI FJ00037]